MRHSQNTLPEAQTKLNDTRAQNESEAVDNSADDARDYEFNFRPYARKSVEA